MLKLNHRIDLQRLELDQDDNTGATLETWVSFVENEPADIVPLSGREFVAAQSVQAGVTTRITIRYRDGVRPAMRLTHGEDVYNIKAVLPDPSLRRHLTLMCEAGVNAG